MSLIQLQCAYCKDKAICDPIDKETHMPFSIHLRQQFTFATTLEIYLCDIDCLEKWVAERKSSLKFKTLHDAVDIKL